MASNRIQNKRRWDTRPPPHSQGRVQTERTSKAGRRSPRAPPAPPTPPRASLRRTPTTPGEGGGAVEAERIGKKVFCKNGGNISEDVRQNAITIPNLIF